MTTVLSLNWIPARKKRRATEERIEREAELTALRERKMDGLIKESATLSKRLTELRRENNFAKRAAQAYERRRR